MLPGSGCFRPAWAAEAAAKTSAAACRASLGKLVVADGFVGSYIPGFDSCCCNFGSHGFETHCH